MLTAGSPGSEAVGCAGASGPSRRGACGRRVEWGGGLALLRAPVVSEPFHVHLSHLAAQAECFCSVERGRK